MKKMKWMALAMAATMLFTACGNENSAGSENHVQNEIPNTQQETEKQEEAQLKEVTLVLDYVPNTNHTGIYVAEKLGYFTEQGLDVEIIEPGDNDSTTLCAVGKAEFAVTYQENVTYARTAGEPLPIRAIATIIQHNTSGFVTNASAGITNPKDFEGKVYAGWQAPSEAAVLEAVMKKYDADFSKLTMVGATGAGLASMQNGIDIQWEFEGWSVINSEYALLTSVNRTLIFFFFPFMLFTPLLSTQGPFSKKVFSFVSTCVSWANSF